MLVDVARSYGLPLFGCWATWHLGGFLVSFDMNGLGSVE